MKLTIISFLLGIQFLTQTASSDAELAISLSSTAEPKGSIRLAIFTDAESLNAEKPVSGEVIELKQTQLPFEVSLEKLPAGEYAIAAYHDLNNDGKLNRNIFGVPSEPYAFSGQPASKWRAPLWSEVVVQNPKELKLALRYWKEQ